MAAKSTHSTRVLQRPKPCNILMSASSMVTYHVSRAILLSGREKLAMACQGPSIPRG